MKTYILTILLLLTANSLFSQTNYYTETKTIHENGYTYQIYRCESGFIDVYNKENKWINKKQTYKSTGEYFDMPDYGLELLDYNAYISARKILFAILEENLSFEENENPASEKQTCFISFYIDSETGKVDDVRFSFHRTSWYINIPISVFRNIELRIKEEVHFVVTDEGKKINYIYCWEDYEF